MRAVVPVITTLLLVAIAVLGGAIIFMSSQGFFDPTPNMYKNYFIEVIKESDYFDYVIYDSLSRCDFSVDILDGEPTLHFTGKDRAFCSFEEKKSLQEYFNDAVMEWKLQSSQDVET